MVFEKLKEILAEQLEDEFKLEVPDEIIEKIETVGDMLNFIENNI